MFNLFTQDELSKAEAVANDLLSVIQAEKARQNRLDNAAQEVRKAFAAFQSALSVLKSS